MSRTWIRTIALLGLLLLAFWGLLPTIHGPVIWARVPPKDEPVDNRDHGEAGEEWPNLSIPDSDSVPESSEPEFGDGE